MPENYKLSFKGEHVIYEKTIKCTIKDYEYNVSYNPSLISNLETKLLNNIATSSNFQPYMTMVGLYNDHNQLLAVGKFAKPIPISPNTDTTILVKLDM